MACPRTGSTKCTHTKKKEEKISVAKKVAVFVESAKIIQHHQAEDIEWPTLTAHSPTPTDLREKINLLTNPC